MATDLDGTIVGEDGEISDRTVAALQGVQALGVPVVFVTGRPPRWMATVAERTGHTGLAICANGGLLWDLHAEAVLDTFPMSVEVGLEVARRLRAAVPLIAFAVETPEGFSHESTYVPRYDIGMARQVADIEVLFAAPAVKLLARHEEMEPADLLRAATAVAGDLAELTYSSSSGLLEISAAGVSKASTLALICGRDGIDAADVVAFGDMPNDLPMLAWAGQAYGIRDAHPEVLAAVEQVVDGPDGDGVARELERLFDL